jgi:protein O-mannosyl-transferase
MAATTWTHRLPARDRPFRFAAAALAVLAAAVYLNALQNGFALDDVHIIERNVRVHNLRDLGAIWLTPYWPGSGEYLGLYRPLPIFLYAIQWAAGGGDPLVFHATSILMHVGVTLLVFLLLERLATSAAAFVGALLFAVHPVHVEAVANVVGQAELIAAAATLGACLLHAVRPDRIDVAWGRRLALALLFAIGVFAKESAVVLPALLVAVDLVQRRVDLSRDGLLRYASAMLMPVFLMAAVLGLYLVLRFDALGGALMGVDAGPQLPYLREEYRLLNAFRAFPEYLRLLFFPQDLIADYAPGVILPVERFSGMVVLGAVILAVLGGLALLTPWTAAGFPAAWFLISIVTVSNLFFPVGVIVAERTLYLPSFALSALVALAWDYTRARQGGRAERGTRRRLVPAALVAIAIVALAARTWTRNLDWRDTAAVQRALLRDHPESYKAQWTHAVRLVEAGDRRGALQHFELAHRIYGRDPQLLLEYGSFLSGIRRVDDAIDLLEAAYAALPEMRIIAMRLASTYLLAGRDEEALHLATDVLAAGYQQPMALGLVAHAYTGMGMHDRAVDTWARVIEALPAPSWSQLTLYARALALAGRGEEAMDVSARARAAGSGDESVLSLLDAFDEAVRAGCYTLPYRRAGTGAPPACDPIWHRITP